MMGAEVTGTGVLQSGGGSQSLALTIPPDANAVVFNVCGWRFGSVLTVLNFDNAGAIDFDLAYRQNIESREQIEVYYMTSANVNWPGTGAKTIYYTIPDQAGADDGPWAFVQPLRNINTADPIGNIDSQCGLPTLFTASLPGAGADDLTYGVSGGYDSVADMDRAGQTELIRSDVFDGMRLSAGYKAAATSFEMDAIGGANDLCRGAHVFKGVAAAAGIPIEINGNQVTDIIMNGSSVAAIYLGSTQLWP